MNEVNALIKEWAEKNKCINIEVRETSEENGVVFTYKGQVVEVSMEDAPVADRVGFLNRLNYRIDSYVGTKIKEAELGRKLTPQEFTDMTRQQHEERLTILAEEMK